MTFKITYATNFLRVFKLPNELPNGYCFGGMKHPVTFKMVDWFNAIDKTKFQKVESVVTQSEAEHKEWVEFIVGFIKGKEWFNPEFTYMILTDYGDVFIVNPEKRADELQEKFDAIVVKAKNKR